MINGNPYQNITALLANHQIQLAKKHLTLGLRDLLDSVTCTVRENLIWDSECGFLNCDIA
jgi:hypothetical protein